MVDEKIGPDEAEVPRNIRVTLEALLSVGVNSREFAPAVKNRRTGQVVDGLHRLETDPNWPTVEIDVDDVTERYIRLILNWNRRSLTPAELSESLDYLAENKKWTPMQIAESTGIAYRTVMKHISQKYKRSYGFNEDKAADAASNLQGGRIENCLDIQEVPVKAEHEPWVPHIPEKLEKAIEALNSESLPPAPENAEILTLEELPEEIEAEQKDVDVILSQEEEPVEKKTPRQIALDIYGRFGCTSDTFVQTSIRRVHPELAEEEIEKIIEETKPEEPPRATMLLGVACPICGTWKTTANFLRTLKDLEKKDPELALLTKERVKRQGVHSQGEVE